MVTVVRPPTTENFQKYLDDVYEAFQAQPRFALILNSAGQPTLPQTFREMQSKWLKEHEQEFRGRWVSAAFVIPSRAIRGAIRAIFWIQPPYFEYTIVAEMEEARSWTEERLLEAGVALDRTGSA